VLGAELRAQPPDVDVDRPRATEEVVTPDLLKQLRASEDTTGVLREVLEEFELLVGQFERPLLQPRGVGRLVDDELADPQFGVDLSRTAVPRGRQPEPGVHLGGAGGGQQDVVSAPLGTHRDQAAFTDYGDDRGGAFVLAGAFEQAAQAFRGREIGARVQEDDVAMTGVQQGCHLGRTYTHGVRKEVERGQYRGRVSFRRKHQKVQAHRHTALSFRRLEHGYGRC